MDMRVTEKSTLWAKISPWIVKKGAYWVNPVLKHDAPEEIVDLFEKWKIKQSQFIGNHSTQEGAFFML